MERTFRVISSISRYLHSNSTLLLKKREFPPVLKIDENDILEKFIKGGGKGGQKINKTNSKVQLKHLPTGIVITSQFSRSREDNRKRARRILGEKVDEFLNKENSRTAIIARYNIHKAQKKRQRQNKVMKELNLDVGLSETPNHQLQTPEEVEDVDQVEENGIKQSLLDPQYAVKIAELINPTAMNSKNENETGSSDSLKSTHTVDINSERNINLDNLQRREN